MLKTKKRNSQSEWIKAWRQAWLEMDTRRAEALMDKAASRIPAGKNMYGWSGGKDALCLQAICEYAGVKNCVWGTIGEQWEFPAFWDFAARNLPSGVCIKDFNVGEDFMIKHPEMVFPQTSQAEYSWYQACNQRAYYEYARDIGADNILLGHRNLDGNNCRSSKNGKVYPIFDFSHEDVFCVLACNGIRLPAIYFYPDGFYHGTHAWIMRSGENAIKEVYNIDSRLLMAHANIPKIRDFLTKEERNNECQNDESGRSASGGEECAQAPAETVRGDPAFL